jgi:hypothetical protein
MKKKLENGMRHRGGDVMVVDSAQSQTMRGSLQCRHNCGAVTATTS